MEATTSRKGQIAESRIIAALVEFGIPVAIPIQADCPYDLIMDYCGCAADPSEIRSATKRAP